MLTERELAMLRMPPADPDADRTHTQHVVSVSILPPDYVETPVAPEEHAE